MTWLYAQHATVVSAPWLGAPDVVGQRPPEPSVQDDGLAAHAGDPHLRARNDVPRPFSIPARLFLSGFF